MNPPTTTLVLVFFASIGPFACAEQTSFLSNESSLEEKTIPEGVVEPIDDSLLFERIAKEDIKLATNSLVYDTTLGPDFVSGEDLAVPSHDKQNDSKAGTQKRPFNEDAPQSNASSESQQDSVSSPAEPNVDDTTSNQTVSSFVPYPSGPDSYETPSKLEAEALTSEEVLTASSREFTASVEDTSPYSTSSFYGRAPPTANSDDVASHENYNSHEDSQNNKLVKPPPEVELMSRMDHATPRGTPTKQKMGKTIKSYKSSAADTLRRFVENGYLRRPIATVVDTTDSNLRNAQVLWNATLKPNAVIHMVLSGYNASGMSHCFCCWLVNSLF